MAYTMDDFRRQYAKDHFPHLTPDELLEVFHALSPEQQQRLLQQLPVEERLAGIPRELILEYLKQLPAEPPQPSPRKPRKKR